MKRFLKKLLIGKNTPQEQFHEGALRKNARNIKSIWNNEQDEDVGIEKLLRLFLAISQFFFFGTYIKQIFGRKGVAYREIAVDAFVFLKTLLPLLVLYLGWEYNDVLFFLIMWFLFETMMYVPSLIFASDIFTRPRSYRRSMLLLFFNYIEIVFSFGMIYARGDYLNKPFGHWFDSVYFSFVTSATIGFGEYYPLTPLGKLLVSAQSTIFLIFVVLFLNFFSTKVEHKGYFDHTKK
ncbi:MAG: two pore domain potassium channel family protein [Bacteroidetes bacterium]|nr:two pore domain potassium channel family protein [Bacteroidota bacterium]